MDTVLLGGKTKKHGRKARRSHRKGGKSCGSKRMYKKGGSSCGKMGGRKTRRTHKKRGGAGMVSGLEGLVKTALVPFGLFAAQKTVQRRRK